MSIAHGPENLFLPIGRHFSAKGSETNSGPAPVEQDRNGTSCQSPSCSSRKRDEILVRGGSILWKMMKKCDTIERTWMSGDSISFVPAERGRRVLSLRTWMMWLLYPRSNQRRHFRSHCATFKMPQMFLRSSMLEQARYGV